MDADRLKLFKKTAYWKETNTIVQHCFAAASKKGMTLTEFAALCDLAPATIRTNIDQLVGLRQELTMWKMCAAVGLKINAINRAQNGAAIGKEMEGIRKALDRKPKQRGKKRKNKRKAKK